MKSPANFCQYHAAQPSACDCQAYAVTLGWMDSVLEEELDRNPAFNLILAARLARAASRGAESAARTAAETPPPPYTP